MINLIMEMANRNIGSLCLFLINEKNIDYLKNIESNIPKEILNRSLSEKIYYYVNNIHEPLLCICGKHRSFIGFKNGYRISCGDKKCYSEYKKLTCIKKYGVDNPKKSKEILAKEKENIKKKWGDHYMLNDEVRNKFNLTMIERYGVKWAQQSKNISNRSKETWENNPNRENIIKNRTELLINKSEEEKNLIISKKIETILNKWGKHYMLDKGIKEKISNVFTENYGFESPFKNEKIAEKRIKSYKLRTANLISNLLPKDYTYITHSYNKNKTGIDIEILHNSCGEKFIMHHKYFKSRLNSNRELCLHCNPILSGKSNKELELLNFIKENYNGDILSNCKSIIDPIELDIFIPELKIAFEFNGLYWHSELYKDKLYHLNKTNRCTEIGIELFHVFEDDWTFKQDIVKSMILNKLGKSKKIFARKCEIREIKDNKMISDFLNRNHIQGFIGSKIKIGLFYQDELVSLMTFGNLRRSLGQKSKPGTWELLRFCNKLNFSIIGGASKLFKYFKGNYNIDKIISYSDNSRGNGNLYEKLGFYFKSYSAPNYYYIIDEVRHHRFNFRKDVLIKDGYNPKKTEVQIMNERNIFRIWDCGAKKWEFLM